MARWAVSCPSVIAARVAAGLEGLCRLACGALLVVGGDGVGVVALAQVERSPTILRAEVSGLVGSGLVLDDGRGGELEVTTDGRHELVRRVPRGNRYAVSIAAQPVNPRQACAMRDASGTATGDVAIVTVRCVTANPVGPRYRVTPVAASASASADGSAPEAVFDSTAPGAGWSSGGAAPQHLTLDLGTPRAVTELRLEARQPVPGASTHRILGGLQPDALEPLTTARAAAGAGQRLKVRLAEPGARWVRFLRIETTQAPGEVGWRRVEVWAAASHMPRWFGYYADGFSWLTPATAELASHVNVSWVGCNTPCPQTLPARIEAARALGLQVALFIPEETFFRTDYSLAPRHRANWAALAEVIRPYLGDLAFIMPMDEPYAQARLQGVDAATMKTRLDTMTRLIRQTFPTLRIATSFTDTDFAASGSPFADLDEPIPADVDYVGFDCYGSWFACGEPTAGTVGPITDFVDRIKSKLGRTQRVMLFTDAFVRAAKPADPAADAARAALLVERNENYYQLAVSDAAVIGLFPFLYQDDYVEEGVVFRGVRHWPRLRARLAEIGAQILANPQLAER